ASADAAVSTRATWRATVQSDRDERTKSRAFVSGLRQALHVAFGASIDTLADFGLKPRKTPAQRTPAEKAAAAAKAKATRAARHTMGRKQKAQIKGAAPVPAPATPPSAPTPPPAPTTPATPPKS